MTAEAERTVTSSPDASILLVEAHEARVALHQAHNRHLSLVFGEIAALTTATLGILAGLEELGVIGVGFAFLIGLEFARRHAKRKLDHLRSVARDLDQAAEAIGQPNQSDPTS